MDNGNVKTLEEETEDDDSQTASLKDESGNEDKVSESMAPRASIYKPKFHKYIQNATTVATVQSSKMDVSTTMNKLGLQLKIPSTSTATQTCSTPSTPSPFTSGSSPSPEFLKKHINKLINENQAIVETTDPFWSKKFYQRKEGSPSSPLSTSSSSSLESCKRIPTAVAVKQEPRSIEDRLPVESKLAHALLQPRVTKTTPTVNDNAIEDAQPLNLTISKDSKSRSHTDENTDDGHRVKNTEIGNDVRFVTNGRFGSDGYSKEAPYGFAKMENSIAAKSKLSIIKHMCSLCDESFDNYDKLKNHILYQCNGAKNHHISSTVKATDNLKSFVKVADTTTSKVHLTQSPGPRLGNTPLVGNYKKLSVITSSLSSDLMKNTISEQKCVTSLKSLEELSNAPMKSNHQFVYNAAFVEDPTKDDVLKSSLKSDEQKVMTVKTPSLINTTVVPITKPKDTNVFKPNVSSPNTPKTTSAKISQFVIPFVQGVPTILSVTTNSELHALTPVAGYKSAALPATAVVPKSTTHVNGGVVTILHGGKVIPYVPGMPGPQSVGPAFMHVDSYEKKNSEAVKRKCDDLSPVNGMIRGSGGQRIDDISSNLQNSKIAAVKIKEESICGSSSGTNVSTYKRGI